MKQQVKIGQTDYTVLVLFRDSTTGLAKTGLTGASAGMNAAYTRVETDNDVTITEHATLHALAGPALTDVHLDWGFMEVDAVHAPGLYRLDLPDEVFATGAWSAVVSLVCTGCDTVHMEFMLVPDAPYTGVNVSQWLGTAAHAAATAGVPYVDVHNWLGAAAPAMTGDAYAEAVAMHVHVDKIPQSDGVLTFNATAAAQFQTEANDALIANNLDHLALTPTAGVDMTTEVADGTIISRIISNSDTSLFVPATSNMTTHQIDMAATHVHAAAADTKTAGLTFTVANQVDANAVAISGVAAIADRIEAWFNGFLTGTVVDPAPGASSFITSSTEASNDHFNNMILVFTGGNLLGQARRISDYTGATKMMYVQPAFTEAPANGDTWILVPIIVGGLDASGRVDVGTWVGTAVTLTAGVPNVNVAAQDNIDFGALQKASITTAVPTVDNILDEVIDAFAPANANTVRKALNILMAGLAAKSSGGGTVTITFRDTGDTKDRIIATVDADGNRTAITLDGT